MVRNFQLAMSQTKWAHTSRALAYCSLTQELNWLKSWLLLISAQSCSPAILCEMKRRDPGVRLADLILIGRRGIFSFHLHGLNTSLCVEDSRYRPTKTVLVALKRCLLSFSQSNLSSDSPQKELNPISDRRTESILDNIWLKSQN